MADEGGDFDSWEDQADSGVFDKRLDEISMEIQSSTDQKKIAPRGQMTVSNESGATQYQPTVRIMKRDPKAPPCEGNKSNSSASKTKSLQQREAEYAEARMRIFGCVSPEDESAEETNTNGVKDGDKNNSSSSAVVQGVPHIYKSAATNTSTSVPVIRQPKGPDGTIGFCQPDDT